jgi:hypothetical protein
MEIGHGISARRILSPREEDATHQAMRRAAFASSERSI